MIGPILGSLVWSFIAQHVATIAAGIAQNVAGDEVKQLLSTFKIRRKVENAVERGFQRFRASVDDPPLLAALERDGGFTSDGSAAAILAQSAINPQERDAQIPQLAAAMQRYAPSLPLARCERAAGLLIEAIHHEISSIPELREGLLLLETRQVRKQLQRAPYAPGLQEGILRAARHIERELGHGYIATGHLLYAIVVQPRSVAAWVLRGFNITELDVRGALVIIRARNEGPPDQPSDGVNAALRRAPELAGERGALETDTEHVLLALTLQALEGGPLGVSIRAVFARLSLDPQSVHDATAQVAQGRGALQSAITSFCGDDRPPAGDGPLPIDMLETLRNFGS